MAEIEAKKEGFTAAEGAAEIAEARPENGSAKRRKTAKNVEKREKEKTGSLQPDVVMKDYWRSNERFADLINAVCFGGETVVRPEELVDYDTEESYLSEFGKEEESAVGIEKTQTFHLARDTMKGQIWGQGEILPGEDRYEGSRYGGTDTESDVLPRLIEICKRAGASGVSIVLWAVDSQDYIHYAMPLRLMGYDYADYKKQYDQNASKYTDEWMKKNHIRGNERMSRMKATDKFSPVITICVYFGEEPWDGPRSLKEMLVIPEKISRWVNDYPMHLVDVRRDSGLVFHDSRNEDLFQILRMLSDKTVPFRKIRENIANYKEGKGVDASVARAVYSLTSRKVLPKVFESEKEVPMDRFVKYLMDEGRKEGRVEGRVEERKERDERIARRMHDRGFELPDIAYALEKSTEQVEKILGLAKA